MNVIRRTKDETGAFAIMFGLLVMFLVVLAAFAVDIGNAVARKSDVQAQADFAALAGARELGTSTSGTMPAAVVDAARDYLNNNSPLNNDCAPTCVTSAELTDDLYPNGEVLWAQDYSPGAGDDPDFCGPSGLCVISPKEHVDYGLAKVIGINGQDVQASATVGIFSPGTGTLPMYAVSGCDYGNQTMTDPAGGHATPVVPGPLALETPVNNAELTSILSPAPPQIPVQNPAGPGPALTLSGDHFYDTTGQPADRGYVTKIGFFFEDGSTFHAVDITSASLNNNTFAGIAAIPQEVATHEGLWWVRVLKERNAPNTGSLGWSEADAALPFRVGNAVLECDAGAESGNFGTLRLPRTDVVNADELPVNIAESFQSPLSLAIHAGADATGMCTPGINGAVESDSPNPGLLPGTNCLGTDPGLAANVATTGFITGLNTSKGFVRGRLDATTHPTDPDCDRNDYEIELGPNDYTINNDVLSCYLNNGSTISSITSSTYSGPSALDDDIYLSPRFFWIPVVAVQPDGGASNRYSIVDFRPGFITDESGSASRGSSDATALNGFHVQGTNVDHVKVIFFDIDALPSTTPGPTTAYLGVGPKILRLID